VDLRVRPGRRASDAELTLTLRSTRGGTHGIRLPAGAILTRLAADGEELPLPAESTPIELPLLPGSRTLSLEWREPRALGTVFSPGMPDLGVEAVNLSLAVAMPNDRWILLARGPAMGPVVLFWGLLLVLAGIAVLLGRVRLTPLSTADWLLLGLGLGLAEVWVGLLVAGWLLALGLRRRQDEQSPRWRYNLIQVGLVVASLAALAGLASAVSQGLLGEPQMQIAGNGSSGGLLHWYQDRGGPVLPQVSVVSVPIWVYRALMLAWALWLAVRLLDWLRWGWEGFASPVLWRETGIGRLRGLKRPEA
jgi:hypothetical protein